MSHSTPNTRAARQARRSRVSRDRWKKRCAAKQQEIRYLRVRVRDLEASRDHWKQQAAAARATAPPPATPLAEPGLGGAPAKRQ